MSYQSRANWVDRAEYLYENTVLSKRQADIQALTEEELSREEIAETLDIAASTVDQHRQEISDRIEKSKQTLDELL